MTLGERCDEIVRLIDETLSDVAGDLDRWQTASGSRATELEFSGEEFDRVLAYEPRQDIGLRGPVGVAS